MNLKYIRTSIGSKEFVRDKDGNPAKVQIVKDIKPYDGKSMSMIYRGTANIDGRNGIKAGDIVYFKANNTRGVNYLGDTEESKGSCEDVAEVLAYYLLRNLKQDTNGASVLRGTPYAFADYSNDDFWRIIKRQTGGMVESDRFYGCVSKNALSENGTIVRGDVILGEIMPAADVKKSTKNTLFNYSQGYDALVSKYAANGKTLFVHPICNRYKANLMIFDIWGANADRHCMNVTDEEIPLFNETEFLLSPTSVLDNGGGFAMQSGNCEKLYESQVDYLLANGRLSETNLAIGYFNPFEVTYDLSAGREIFANPEIAALYDEASYLEQVLLLISQNKILFNDFKLMYQNLNMMKAMDSMKADLRFPMNYGKENNYLPGLPVVLNEAVRFKKEKFSKIMATMLGEEFDEEKFGENDSYYLDKFEQIVLDDALLIHIASDEECKKFDESMKTKLAQKSF